MTRPLLLRDIEAIAAEVWTTAVLESVSARSRAVLLVRAVLDGNDAAGTTAAEARRIREAAAELERADALRAAGARR